MITFFINILIFLFTRVFYLQAMNVFLKKRGIYEFGR